MGQTMTIERTGFTDMSLNIAPDGAGLEIPHDAQLVMSALEAGNAASAPPGDRRRSRRRAYRTIASLWLFSDPMATPLMNLYTRDISRRGLGFITRIALPLGYGGIVELPAPDGRLLNLHCTVLRCRQTVPEWYEGHLHFNRDQLDFDCD
jgi:hypothetical protein